MPAGNAIHQPPPPNEAAVAELNAQAKQAANPQTCGCAAAGMLLTTAPASSPAVPEGQLCSTCRCRPAPPRDGTCCAPAVHADDAPEQAPPESADGLGGAVFVPVLEHVGGFVEEPVAEEDEHDDSDATPPASPRLARASMAPTRRRTEPALLIATTSPASASSSPKPKPVRSVTTAVSTKTAHDYTLDPFMDITRLRIRSRGSHCLYPGATFQGIQKSGTNNYEVNVQIVDVDLPSSFLCGYLCIRGLTDDWPEMTTYFDAEIIGGRHGFMTGKWGATDDEDLKHWARFPAFKQLRSELEGPRLTMPPRDRGVIFMRWKERFLVPDHRVQDVSGASFAGFYYICIDMDGRAGAEVTRSPVMMTRPLSGQDGLLSPKTPTSPKLTREMLPGSMNRRLSSGTRVVPATMSGFYYHANSEPYQQLSLSHVPEVSQSSFEFR